MSKRPRTTNAQYKTYVKWFMHYVRKWELTGWTFHFYHGCPQGHEGAAACMSIRHPLAHRTCDTHFTRFADILGREPIRQVAKHEVCHLFIARLEVLAMGRETNMVDIAEEDEHLANKLQHFLPD